MDKLSEGRRVFDVEIDALRATRDALDDTFVQVLDRITGCRGKLILTGMGKSGHIAAKLAATFSSLGTPSFYMNAGEAMHGDLGMVSVSDVVVAISHSGETEELLRILPTVKAIGAFVIGLTGNPGSTLAEAADLVQVLPGFEEACRLGLAPTSSTTAALCYGDALAVAASRVYGFQSVDFGLLHPAGALGKRAILRVRDLMSTGADDPRVASGTLLIHAIATMSQKGLGVVSVVDGAGRLLGVFTDGDLRRTIERHTDVYSVAVDQVMTRDPKRAAGDMLAVDALSLIKKHSINNLPVVDAADTLVGTITWQQIVKAGVMV